MMTEREFNFLQDHSERFLKMALSTERRESVRNPDGYGKNTGDCGDTVEIFLTVRRNQICSVSFIVDGCINTHACANTVARLVEGKTVGQAWGVASEMVIDYLQTLPAESTHCAELAVGALYKALANFREIRRNPWKKLYPAN